MVLLVEEGEVDLVVVAEDAARAATPMLHSAGATWFMGTCTRRSSGEYLARLLALLRLALITSSLASTLSKGGIPRARKVQIEKQPYLPPSCTAPPPQ